MNSHIAFSLRMVFTVILMLAFVGLVLVAMARLAPTSTLPVNTPGVVDFTTCVASQYPIIESMPRHCMTPDGRIFYEDIPQNIPVDLPRIVVTAPASGAYIADPTTVKGFARGYWFFEASFPVEIRDAAGVLLAVGPAQAEGDWMTQNYVAFSATLAWSARPSTATGTIIFRRDNPSGLPENDANIVLPISFVPLPGITRVNVLFVNASLGSADDCRLVFPLSRDIPTTFSVASATLAELLRGPDEKERAAGYMSLIPQGTVIRAVTINSGVITADFTSKLSAGVAGSCMVGGIRAQLEETLRQFPTVNTVVISAEGRTEDILQP